ncbi:hypothetical protein LTR66_014161, partial [Elasticomyces elasticus]
QSCAYSAQQHQVHPTYPTNLVDAFEVDVEVENTKHVDESGDTDTSSWRKEADENVVTDGVDTDTGTAQGAFDIGR